VYSIAGGANCFEGYTNIYSVTLSPDVSGLPDDTFDGCIHLVEIRDLRNDREENPLSLGSGIAKYALNIYTNEADKTLSKTDDYFFCKNSAAQAGENKYSLIAYMGTQQVLTLPSTYNGEGYDIFDSAFLGNDTLQQLYMNNTGVKHIGNDAFNRCTSLQTLMLPSGLLTIGEDAFFDCILLREIEIPASVTQIGANAFFNCYNLSKAEFAEGGAGLAIGEAAFGDCRSLVAVNFPAHLKELQAQAFSGTGLSAVYLPDGVDYLANEDGTRDYFDSASLVHFVFKTRDAYLNGLTNDAIATYQSRMTYLVNISFDFGTEQTYATEVRLAGQIYSYTAGDNYAWSGTAQDHFVSLPLQDGYGTSVWYSDDQYRNKVGVATFGGTLVGSDNSGLDELLAETTWVSGTTCYAVEDNITLYAPYTVKPTLTGKSVLYRSSARYNLNDEQYLFDLVGGWYEFVNENGDLLIASYNGDTEGYIGPDAGTYTLEFQLKDSAAYGAWAVPVTVDAVIEKYSYDVGSNSDWRISWDESMPVSLIESQKIYIYQKDVGGGSVPFAAQLTDEQIEERGLRPNPEVRTVVNSVARYRSGKEITLDYVFKYEPLSAYLQSWEFIDSDEEGNYQRAASEPGVYTVRIDLTANDNYRLYSNLIDANDRGIVINFRDDGSIASVIKTWYIVELSNQVIVDKEYGSFEERIPYSIAGWTFGDSDPVLPNAPTIEVFDRSLGEEATLTRLGFTLSGMLYSGGIVTFTDVQRSNFRRFINASMPAGTYTLTVRVPEVTDEAEVFYPAYAENFSFTVSPAVFDGALFEEVDTALKDQAFEFARDGDIHFYDPEISLRILSLRDRDLNPVLGDASQNVWARSEYRQYYSTAVSISYNLNRMANSSYYTEREFNEERTQFAPRSADVYTVYYQVSAKNYVPHVDVSSDAERRAYSFTVTIYEVFNAPNISTQRLVYTGEEVLPEIGESSSYEVRRRAGDDYTSVGEHALILRLYNFVPSKWATQDLPTGEDDPNMEFELVYEISRARNETVGTLNLISWTWGSYQEDNTPVFNTRFKDEADSNFYTFTLTSLNNPNDVYTYGTDKGFDIAPAGSYVFKAYAKGYDADVAGSERYSWEAYSTQLDEIRISPATNRWLETPNIVRWFWGDYSSEDNLITARPAYPRSGAVVIYTVLDENRQLVKDGNGNVVTALQNFTNGADGTVNDSVAAALGNLNVGTYYLIAKAAGDNNYTALDTSAEGETPISFQILQAQNLWVETPNILSWNEGNYDAAVNLMFARAKFGDAVITITHMDG
ncbi:MAG: leucine-rich repeat domain-containing protein, partial [Clostridiales bacterium]|nr:leucine-rich repeat domain-containing protein [Clostridiales bacterium]